MPVFRAPRSPLAVLTLVIALCAVCAASAALPASAAAQAAPGVEHRVLATNKTSTMEKELNEAAELGFRYKAVMGGDTAIGGAEVVVVTAKNAAARSGRYSYKLLATNRTSTMEKELQAAADLGFEYVGQTIFKSMFGGQEVVCILERDKDNSAAPPSYRLLATNRTGTMQRELNEIGAAGYEVVGLTVGKTAIGGTEIVSIARRPGAAAR